MSKDTPDTLFAQLLHHYGHGLAPGDSVIPPIVPTAVYHLPGTPSQAPYQYGRFHNPTWEALEDALGLLDDMPIEIESRHGRTRARVRLADDIRRGVISLAHGFEDANPAALIDDASSFDALSGLPRMSAIPVRIVRASR